MLYPSTSVYTGESEIVWPKTWQQRALGLYRASSDAWMQAIEKVYSKLKVTLQLFLDFQSQELRPDGQEPEEFILGLMIHVYEKEGREADFL